MIDAYTRCNVCEASPAECLYDGDPMCYDCRAATAKVKREHPELSEKESCIGCGAEVCEDALCKQDADAEIEPVHPDHDHDYEDNMTDAEADADALASAGWGTDEDYGYYGDD
jgi:hypothetical protein